MYLHDRPNQPTTGPPKLSKKQKRDETKGRGKKEREREMDESNAFLRRVLFQEFLGLVDFGGQIRAATSIGMIE